VSDHLLFAFQIFVMLGLLTCKNRLPYNLYCVGGDVKHCSIQSVSIHSGGVIRGIPNTKPPTKFEVSSSISFRDIAL